MTAIDIPTLLEQYAAAPPTDLYAATGPADDVFNQLAPDLAPLYWQVNISTRGLPTEIRGQVPPGTDNTDATTTLAAWAANLSLPHTDRSLPGMLEYFDLRDGCYLVVWGIVDQERWTNEARRIGVWSA
ncbi:hypothetical protein ABZS29_38430 [Kribbella sp. NPDC005582]|uniref:hypothetical protein n=1 Tax=Kribbella sp. NPDC005582 TaxID=3156893 RepID=UPI0033ADB262